MKKLQLIEALRTSSYILVPTSVVVGSLEPLSAPPEAPIVEHILGGGVQGPVVALTWLAGFSGNLMEGNKSIKRGNLRSSRIPPMSGRESF